MIIMFNKKTAPFIMVVLAVLFGLNYVWTKIIVERASAFTILFYCNVFGLIVTFILVKARRLSFKADIGFITLVNSMFLLTLLLEMIGIKYTTSSNASFIIQFSVVAIPIVAAIYERRFPAARILLIGVVALVGIAVMTLDTKLLAVNAGDPIMILTAIAFSVYVVLLEKIDPTNDVTVVVFYYSLTGVLVHFVLSVATGGLAALAPPFGEISFTVPLAACAVTSLLAVLVQVEVVKFIKPESMAVYYCLEPIAAVLAANALLNEVVTPRIIVGGAIVMVSIFASMALEKRRKATI